MDVRPPCRPECRWYSLSVFFDPPSAIFEALTTTTKSPPSTCGAKVALCLPRSRVATVTARRPRTTSSASMTCQALVISPGLGLYVDTVVTSFRLFEVNLCLRVLRRRTVEQHVQQATAAQTTAGPKHRSKQDGGRRRQGPQQVFRIIVPAVAGVRGHGYGVPMTDSLTVRDNRTGREYELAITDGTIQAADLKQIAVDGQPGLATYDPGFVNTASCRSAVTFIDGDAGILEYRGYPIEQLAQGSSFLEVAYLLIHGELPSKQQYDSWVHEITYHTFVHENVRDFMEGFRYDAHPMGMLLASVGALSTFYPEAKNISDPENRHIQIVRMISKMPTLGAWAFRHAQGKPYVYPDNELSYTENFLSMLFKMSELRFEADPRLVKALDVLFILHADHEQNCSTNAVRSVGSTQV